VFVVRFKQPVGSRVLSSAEYLLPSLAVHSKFIAYTAVASRARTLNVFCMMVKKAVALAELQARASIEILAFIYPS
jgi:hypothetical protein